GGLDADVEEIGPEWVEVVEIEALKQCQLLQQNGPLAPWPAFRDGIALIAEGERRLDRSLPARQVVAGEQPAMTAARGVEHLLAPANAVDRPGDKPAGPPHA